MKICQMDYKKKRTEHVQYFSVHFGATTKFFSLFQSFSSNLPLEVAYHPQKQNAQHIQWILFIVFVHAKTTFFLNWNNNYSIVYLGINQFYFKCQFKHIFNIFMKNKNQTGKYKHSTHEQELCMAVYMQSMVCSFSFGDFFVLSKEKNGREQQHFTHNHFVFAKYMYAHAQPSPIDESQDEKKNINKSDHHLIWCTMHLHLHLSNIFTNQSIKM